MTTLRGIFGEQDGRLRQQANEHDESHLQVDIVLDTEHLGKQQRTAKAERHAEDDGQGNEEALVKRNHNEIDEEDADDVRVIASELTVGKCSKTVRFENSIDVEKITAKYKSGIVLITIPKLFIAHDSGK